MKDEGSVGSCYQKIDGDVVEAAEVSFQFRVMKAVVNGGSEIRQRHGSAVKRQPEKFWSGGPIFCAPVNQERGAEKAKDDAKTMRESICSLFFKIKFFGQFCHVEKVKRVETFDTLSGLRFAGNSYFHPMGKEAKKWQIWIDAGGTFTDCIAINPAGEKVRAKVLSSSTLRGTLVRKIAPRKFQFAHKWSIGEDIFQDYYFQILNQKNKKARIERINFEKSTLRLNHDLPFSQPLDFEIAAGEEAPILAARIATRTPLKRPLPPLHMRLGSTKGTNALLEKKGAEVALLITKGFKDLIAIGTQQRPHLFQLNIPEPEVIYRHVLEVEERLDASGRVLQPLSEKELQRLLFELKKKKAKVVAVALLHAYLNPAHERKLGQALEKEGFSFISLSHQLTPSIKILPRAKTALVNAYLAPTIQNYLSNIQSHLHRDSSLKVMTSAGGLADAAHFFPKDSLLSGPAGGVVGATKVAQSLGFQKILTLDMGGTSSDTARYDGHYDYEFVTKVGGLEMLSPTLAIETVAAGGGSICHFDGHKLCVGPESAGASPGPACYGAGGPLAITDVNLLLGKLDPSVMGIPVNVQRAKKALLNLQKEIFYTIGEQYSEEELLRGFERIANEKMADAIRRISVAKGIDPKDYALLVFGGAGGLHACKIAELLGIETVILPFDGGLLSAFGIGNARVERLAEKQVLKALDDCKNDLPSMIQLLENQAVEKLEKEGFSKSDIEIKSRFAYLRFKGQDSALEIELSKAGSFSTLSGKTGEGSLTKVETTFEKEYRHLFGHYPRGGVIEVESIKIIAATKEKIIGEAPFRLRPRKVFLSGKNVFHWSELEEGDCLEGPAILLHSTSTAFIEKNWKLEIVSEKNALLHRIPTMKIQKGTHSREEIFSEKEAIELELFTNRFTAIAEEMGAQLQRTAFSVNIKERLDFSCALLDANAELLVNAPHIPVHLGSLGICARLVKEKIDLGRGDVVITNHPKYGGSHLPDVTLMSAVFSDEKELIGYVINRAHHAEIGGKRPGSMPPDATTLEEEGIVLEPFYLVKNGQVRWQVLEEKLIGSPNPTRALHENLADINAALASLRTGEEKLRALVKTHGLPKVHHYMDALKNTSFEALKNALQAFEKQTFKATEQLDDGHTIQLRIEVTDSKTSLHFEGTSQAHPFNLNANISIVYSAVIYVLRLLCKKEIPLNEGLMQNVEIHLPEGTFLHPAFSDNPAKCPAVVGGNTEVSQRLVDTLLKAFGLAACSQGTMNNFLFGNDHFGYYETIGGGVGAGAGFDGRSAVHQHMTNTKITDPEELELRYPLRLHRFAIRNNSGGRGRWNGGDGILREIEFLAEVEMTLISQHRAAPPYGTQGGAAGKCGRQYILRANGERETLDGVDSRKLFPGDRVVIETPGGGGWGKP